MSLERVLASRKQLPTRNRLTPEGQRKLRATALKHRPWTRSTGPKSPEGKAKSAANGLKRQRVPGSPSVRQLRRELAGANTLMSQMAEVRRSVGG